MAFQALQDEASARAQAAFHKLPHGDALFQQCAGGHISIDTVLETLRHKAASARRKQSTRLLDTFHRTTAWMLNIAPSIDVAVNASAGIACPVWAPIKFVLMAVRENTNAIENILEVVQHIADNLTRLDLYKQFQDEPQFQVALVNLFADITEFSIRAYQFFKRRSMIRVGLLIGRNFRNDFDAIITSIQRRTKVVDDTATALHQQRMQLHIEATQARVKQESRVRTIQWLRPSNTREYHDQRLSSVVNNTCEWIFGNATFCRWLKNPRTSSTGESLIIHGRPGSGKSVLASYIYNMLVTTTPEISTVASLQPQDSRAYIPLLFSFSSSDTDRQTLASMSRTLLSQVLEHDKDSVALDLICTLQERSSVSTGDLFDTLGQALELLPCPVVAIIDGVDECSESTASLLQYVNSLFQKTTRLKTLLVGQSHSFTRLLASTADTPSIAIGPELNHADINAVVDAKMEIYANRWTVSVCEVIAKSLKANADGMFLWVRLMIDYLNGASCESDLYACLDNLPEGLDQTYNLLLDRLCTRISKHQQLLFHRVLSVITTCGRPLQLSELRLVYALMIEPEENVDPKTTESHVLRLQPQDLIELCGGFVIYSDERFHIIHNSAREYLTASPTAVTNDILSQATLKINLSKSHEILSKVCVKAFREIDESNCSESFLQSRTALKLYASLYTAYHLNNSGRTREELQKSVAELFQSTEFFHVTEEMTPQEASDAGFQFIDETVKLWGALYPDAQWPENDAGRVSEASLHSAQPYVDDEPTDIDHITAEDPSEHNTTIMAVTARDSDNLWEPTNDTTIELESRDAGLTLARNIATDGSLQSTRLRAHSHKAVMTLRPQIRGANAMRTIRYFNLSMKVFRPLFVGKVLSDPMKMLFDSVRRATPSMPPSLMAAITWYYFRMNKYEEAYEIGIQCAEKMGPKDTLLRMLLELLVGHVAYYLYKYAQAIPYLEYAYANIQRIPSFTHDHNVFVINLADAYRCNGQQEKSLEVLRSLVKKVPASHLSEQDSLRVAYNSGTCEWDLGDLDAAIDHFFEFQKRCKTQYGNPIADYPEWPSMQYVDTHYTLGQCLFNARRDKEALAKFEEYEFLRKDPIPGVSESEHEALVAYKAALDYEAKEPMEIIRRSMANQCLYRRSDRCFRYLRERLGVYITILWEDDMSQRAISTAMKYLEAFDTVHFCDRSPCKLEAGHAWHMAQRYAAEADLYYSTDNHTRTIECMWKTLEAFNEHHSFLDHGVYGNLEVLAYNLSIRLSESDGYGDLLLATYCAQASSRILLQLPDWWLTSFEDMKGRRDRVRSNVLDLQIRLWTHPTPTLNFNPAVKNRISFLQNLINLYCPTKKAISTTEALILPDAWRRAQDRYLVRG